MLMYGVITGKMCAEENMNQCVKKKKKIQSDVLIAMQQQLSGAVFDEALFVKTEFTLQQCLIFQL